MGGFRVSLIPREEEKGPSTHCMRALSLRRIFWYISLDTIATTWSDTHGQGIQSIQSQGLNISKDCCAADFIRSHPTPNKPFLGFRDLTKSFIAV